MPSNRFKKILCLEFVIFISGRFNPAHEQMLSWLQPETELTGCTEPQCRLRISGLSHPPRFLPTVWQGIMTELTVSSTQNGARAKGNKRQNHWRECFRWWVRMWIYGITHKPLQEVQMGTNTSEMSLAGSMKAEPLHTEYTSTPKYLPQSVHSNIVRNKTQNLEASPVPPSSRMAVPPHVFTWTVHNNTSPQPHMATSSSLCWVEKEVSKDCTQYAAPVCFIKCKNNRN